MIVLAFTYDRERCGVSDFTNHLYPDQDCLGAGIKVRRVKVTLANCLRAPFAGADVVHLQHEYSLLGFAGYRGFLLLLYWQLLRLACTRLVITLHTVYDWNRTAEIFLHRTRSSLVLWLLKVYGKTYHWLLLRTARALIFVGDDSRRQFEATNRIPRRTGLAVIPIGVYVDTSPAPLTPSLSPSDGERIHRNDPRAEPPSRSAALVEDPAAADTIIQGAAAGAAHTTALRFKEREGAKDLAAIPIQPGDFVFTLFGFAYPNKGYHLAIEALDQLRTELPSLKLLVVSGEPAEGGREYLRQLRALAAARGLAERVVFTGFLPADDPRYAAVLARTDCFLYPYLQESATSGSLATTLAARKLYVTSDLKMFERFTAGLKFRAGDAAQLGELMRQMARLTPADRVAYRARLDDYIAANDVYATRRQHAEAFRDLMK